VRYNIEAKQESRAVARKTKTVQSHVLCT